MASTFKITVEIGFYNLHSLLVAHKASGHHEHIGIVVGARQLSELGLPAEGCTDALMLVEGDVDAVTGATLTSDGVSLMLQDCFGKYVTFLKK